MRYLLVLSIIFLNGCSGYRVQNTSNPFEQYGIKSINIPMFYNHSNYSNVSNVFTKEIYQTLLGFRSLKLNKGSNSDAVLIGIIESPTKMSGSIKSGAVKSAQNTFGEDSIGDRADFLLPTLSNMSVGLRIIVIKHPTKSEIEFLQTKLASQALSSKIIFNERISLSRDYNLKQLQGEGIKVLGTQNSGLERENIKDLAKSAASSFRNMILYAF